MKKITLVSLILFALIFASSSIRVVHAQRAQLECGTTHEDNFAGDGERHEYLVELLSEAKISAVVMSLSPRLEQMRLWVFPENNNSMGAELASTNLEGNPKVETRFLPKGIYKVEVWNFSGIFGGGRGEYSLTVNCITRDGAEVKSDAAAFSGVGFPGLSPVDFSSVAKIPLVLGSPMSGAVTPTGSEILGYTFEGEAGGAVGLSFTRLSGNLNLGLVVLSSDNKVVYQASLVTVNSMSVQFVLPRDGEYTVGVFRIELLPPVSPEATAFQVQVKLE